MASRNRLLLRVFVLAVFQVLRYLINRRLACKLIRPTILDVLDIQFLRDALQYAQRLGRLPLCKEIDLQLQVIAPFQSSVDQALADQHAGGEENGFEREDRREQRERIFVESVMREKVAEDDPADHERALKNDKLNGADEPADPVKQTVMNRQSFFILLFKAKDCVDALGGGPR